MDTALDLTGKKAIITGASRGIGRAIALGYARAGADVALLARDATALDGVAAEVAAAGRHALVVRCDVTDSEQVQRAIDSIIGEFASLDILVNNAGGSSNIRPFLTLSDSAWEKELRLNLYSAVYLCRAVGPHLITRGAGSVINVSSFAGTGGLPLLSPYAAAKAALISLTQSLAVEWAGRGPRVNVVVPGWIATDLTAAMSADPQSTATLLKSVPAGRWGDAQDIVGAALYLASDAAQFVTGSCLTVDGGMGALTGGTVMRQLLGQL